MPTAALIDISSRHQVYLEGLKTSETKEVLVFLKEMDRAVRARLANKDLTTFTRTRLDKLIDLINKDIDKIMGNVVVNLNTQVDALAQYEAGFEIRSLNQVVDVNFDLPSVAALRTAVFSNPLSIPNPTGGNVLGPFIKSMTPRAKERVSSAIRGGYYRGESLNKILQAVRGTRANGFKDGVIGHTGRDINTVTRTALQHAAQQSRQAVWQANESIISRVRWVSTLDSRTSAICQGLDGQTYPLDKGPRPPIHANCRSTTTVVLADKFASISEGRTRSSRNADGSVKSIPSKMNYYDWLKTQPVDFQDSAIGPTRGKLLRNGGLTSQRFQELQLGRNFRPRTLVEIRGLEPVAFGKANIKVG